MKSLGNVATALPRQDNGSHDVTMSDNNVSVKSEDRRHPTPVPRLGIQKHGGKSSIQTHPAKAPLEITNAIRRRQETSDLDYWHTLPPAPPQPHPQSQQPPTQPSYSSSQTSLLPPKPFYRAVLRGSLYGENAATVCTLSSIVDAVSDKEYNMVIRKHNGHLSNGYHFNGNGNLIHNKNFSVVRAEDMGLTINGLSITEMKATKTQPTNMTSPVASPRVNGWKGYSSVGFVKQRRQSSQYNNNINTNNKSNTNDKNNVDADQAPIKNGKTNNSKTTNLPQQQQASMNNNTKGIQRNPRLYLTTRQTNNNNNVEHNNIPDPKRGASFSPRSESSCTPRKDSNNNNNYTSHDALRPNTPIKQRGLLRQASLPISTHDAKPQTTTDYNHGNHPNTNSKTQHVNNMDTTVARRKFSNELDNCKKLTKQDSLPNPSSSSCLQFADSIISALTVDLNKMYSICQTKVRYAEFIEQSQPHRLDEANGNMASILVDESGFHDTNRHKLPPKDFKNNDNNISNNNNNNSNFNNTRNNSCLSKQNSKETSSSFACSSSSSSSSTPPSSSSPSSSTTSSNVIINPTSKSNNPNTSQGNKTSLPLRLAPLTPKTNKYTTLREIRTPDLLDNKAVSTSLDILDSGRARVARPILKSSKTDIDSSLPSFRPAGDKTDSNNNASMGSNRLVRFKVNHEVREFAPSEPVRYY